MLIWYSNCAIVNSEGAATLTKTEETFYFSLATLKVINSSFQGLGEFIVI